jgi:uncharacterized protein YaaN involved in tellurite resistance
MSSTPPPPVRDELSLPDIGTIKSELNLPAVTEIEIEASEEAAIETQADALVEKLIALDGNQAEQREQARAAVESMAIEVQREAAHRSAMLKEPLRDLSTRAEDGGEVAVSLVGLREQIEELDPAELNFDQGWFGRLLGKLPGVGTPIRRYFARYESSQSVIDDIIHSLQRGKEQLQRDNITLTEDQKALRSATHELERASKLGQLIDQKLDYRCTRDLAQDEERKRFVEEELLFPLRQRVQDIQQQLLVAQQGFLTTEMIIRNNKELIRGVDRAINVTVNALQIAVTLALALAHQRVTLDKIQAVNETTNNLIAGTASRLREQGAEIQKQASSTSLDMSTLKQAFVDINAALEDVSRYRQEALPKMAQNILEMDQMAAEAEATIQRAEQARSHSAELAIEPN